MFHEPATVTKEAMYNWYWLYELIEGDAEVQPAHGQNVRLIAEAVIGTYKIDAHIFACLERTSFLVEFQVSSEDKWDVRAERA